MKFKYYEHKVEGIAHDIETLCTMLNFSDKYQGHHFKAVFSPKIESGLCMTTTQSISSAKKLVPKLISAS